MPLSRAIRAIFKSLSRLKGSQLLETLDTSRVLRWLLFPMLNNSMRSSGMCRRQNLAKKKSFTVRSSFTFRSPPVPPLPPLPYFFWFSLTFLFYVFPRPRRFQLNCPYLGMIWKLSSPPTPRGVYFHTYTGMCRWTGCGFCPFCPKQGIQFRPRLS